LSNFYKDKRWSDFREQIFEIDGYACVKCGRKKPEVVLQVHHREYHSGKAPWDYSTGICETLCKGCHAREHGEIRPGDGWDLINEEDLGDLLGVCDCCDKLTGTDEATQFKKNLDRLNDRNRGVAIFAKDFSEIPCPKNRQKLRDH
jgi:hypothetical protein